MNLTSDMKKLLIIGLIAISVVAGCTQQPTAQAILTSSNIQVSDVYLDHVYRNHGQNCDSCRSDAFQGCELSVGFTVRANLPQSIASLDCETFVNNNKIGIAYFTPSQLEWHDGPYGMGSKISVFEPVEVKLCCDYGQRICTSKTVNALCS